METGNQKGAEREWALLTRAFLGDEQGNLRAIKLVEVEWKLSNECLQNFFSRRYASRPVFGCLGNQ